MDPVDPVPDLLLWNWHWHHCDYFANGCLVLSANLCYRRVSLPPPFSLVPDHPQGWDFEPRRQLNLMPGTYRASLARCYGKSARPPTIHTRGGEDGPAAFIARHRRPSRRTATAGPGVRRAPVYTSDDGGSARRPIPGDHNRGTDMNCVAVN